MPNPAATLADAEPSALFDGEQVDELAEALGDDGLSELFDLFRRDLGFRMPLLEAAAARHDRDGYRRAAHAISSAAVSIGAVTLALACRAAEQAARSPAPGWAGTVLAIRSAVAATLDALPVRGPRAN